MATNLLASSGRSASRTRRSKTSAPRRASSSGLRRDSIAGMINLQTDAETSHFTPGWVGWPLFAGGATSAPGELAAPGPDHMPFWPERDSIFRSSYATTFIAASRYVDPSTRSWSPTASMLAVAISARALVAILADEDTLSRELGTPPLPEAHPPVGYCWQNSRCRRLLRGRSTATSTTSCRTLTPRLGTSVELGIVVLYVNATYAMSERCKTRGVQPDSSVIEQHMMVGANNDQIRFRVRPVVWLAKGLDVVCLAIKAAGQL